MLNIALAEVSPGDRESNKGGDSSARVHGQSFKVHWLRRRVCF